MSSRDWIDAHVHVWSANRLAWPRSADSRDYPPEDFTPEAYLRHAEPAGVKRAVLVQMSFYESDHSYLLEVLRRHPGRFAGVGLLSPNATPAAMDELSAKGLRAFRITSEHRPDVWRHAASRALTLCPLINPDALPLLDRLCAEFPETTVVIDHLARIGIGGEVRDDDVRALCRLAAHPKVHVKISAFYALGLRKAPYTDLAPLIERVFEAYGARRLMWASDCPFQVLDGHTLKDSIALVRDRLPFLSDADRESILRDTAARLFFASGPTAGLGPTPAL
jgi:predicted TIM-barrel fold metal-dependent hydrolase